MNYITEQNRLFYILIWYFSIIVRWSIFIYKSTIIIIIQVCPQLYIHHQWFTLHARIIYLLSGKELSKRERFPLHPSLPFCYKHKVLVRTPPLSIHISGLKPLTIPVCDLLKTGFHKPYRTLEPDTSALSGELGNPIIKYA